MSSCFFTKQGADFVGLMDNKDVDKEMEDSRQRKARNNSALSERGVQAGLSCIAKIRAERSIK
jgi:hypothetical protein